MNTKDHPRTVENPWKTTGANKAKDYSINSDPICSHRGVEVFPSRRGGYLFVYRNMAITHRSKFKSQAEIDAILDGTTPVSIQVASRLRECGFKSIGWDQVSELN